MTEKIIIDGIDVSGCHHYKNRACIADYCYTDMEFSEAKCSLSPNCYYKQLQRIKAQYKAVVEQNKSLQTELKQKEQECEEYKKLHTVIVIEEEDPPDDVKNVVQMDERLFNMYECRIVELETECEELKEKYKWYEHYKDSALSNKEYCNRKIDEINKYKQTFDEIEELTQKLRTKTDYHGEDEVNADLDQILEIINKAKEVNNVYK